MYRYTIVYAAIELEPIAQFMNTFNNFHQNRKEMAKQIELHTHWMLCVCVCAVHVSLTFTPVDWTADFSLPFACAACMTMPSPIYLNHKSLFYILKLHPGLNEKLHEITRVGKHVELCVAGHWISRLFHWNWTVYRKLILNSKSFISCTQFKHFNFEKMTIYATLFWYDFVDYAINLRNKIISSIEWITLLVVVHHFFASKVHPAQVVIYCFREFWLSAFPWKQRKFLSQSG